MPSSAFSVITLAYNVQEKEKNNKIIKLARKSGEKIVRELKKYLVVDNMHTLQSYTDIMCIKLRVR